LRMSVWVSAPLLILFGMLSNSSSHAKTPNKSLQPTASRRTTSFSDD
jgi:hypothetical protein